MGPKPKVPFWDVKYTDMDGNSKIAEIKAFDHLQCTREFRAIYKGEYQAILGMKQRDEATVSALE